MGSACCAAANAETPATDNKSPAKTAGDPPAKPAKEEPKTEAPKADVNKAPEPTKEQPTKEEPTKEEPKKEDAPRDKSTGDMKEEIRNNVKSRAEVEADKPSATSGMKEEIRSNVAARAGSIPDKNDAPAAEAPAEAPAAEAPAAKAPPAEAAAEAPAEAAAETPAAEAPAAEEPAAEAPAEAPAAEAPPADAPAAEAPPAEAAPAGSNAKCFVIGPPSSGKGYLVSKLVKDKGLTHLRETWLADAATKKALPSAAKAEGMEKPLPDELLMEMLLELMGDSAAGFVVDSIPKTEAQAQAVKGAGVKLVVVDISEAEVLEFHANRVVDSETGTSYDLKTSPPPEGDVAARCVKQGMDEEEQVKQRLAPYYAELPKIEAAFGDQIIKIKGTTEKGDAEAAMFTQLCSELGA